LLGTAGNRSGPQAGPASAGHHECDAFAHGAGL
jgi:hypothetical protein